MVAPLTSFSEQKELLQFARRFLTIRTTSLENDVKRCLAMDKQFDEHSHPAAFPAILYCFSTTDLLGALYEGNATRNANHSKQSTEYMQKFMHYTEEQTRLLQTIFRHKIVHLAEPKAIIEDNKRLISWRYCHDDLDQHLTLSVPSNIAHYYRPSRIKPVVRTHEFTISIVHFQRDICDSVVRPNGYLATLEHDEQLQTKFDTAIGQIYSPQEPKRNKCPDI